MDIDRAQHRREQFRVSQHGHRLREKQGLALYDIPVSTARLIDGLVLKGYLRDADIFTHRQIQHALASAVDEIICRQR
jgi:hypothetical protein